MTYLAQRSVIQRGGRRRAGGLRDGIGDKRDIDKVAAEEVDVEGENACEGDIKDSDNTAIGTEDDDEQ